MVPRALAMVLLLASTATSGCLFWPSGHCGPYYEGVTWQEPGLFSALAANGTRHPVDHGAFPFQHDEADERWGPFYGVSSVWFNVGGGHGRGSELQVMLHPGHTDEETVRYGGEETYVYVRGGDTHDDQAWRDVVYMFLDRTVVVMDDRDAWVEALLAARTVEGEGWVGGDRSQPMTIYGANLPVQREPDLTALAEGLGAKEPRDPTAHGERFTWTGDNGTWEFHIALAVRQLALDSSSPGETEFLTVDAGDAVAVTIQQDIGDDETAIKTWLRDRFAAHGLPEPRFERFEVRSSVC